MTSSARNSLRSWVDPEMPAVSYFSYPDFEGAEASPWLMQAKGLAAGYGNVPAIRDIDLEIAPGEIVALLGPNGAGKTSTLLALSGLLRPMAGSIWWSGELTEAAPHQRARQGMAYVTEERNVFTQMRVRDNLRVSRGDHQLALEMFPELNRLLERRAGLLSGGEQQMLSLARALSRRPNLLLVDELSMGLAPTVVRRLLDVIRTAAEEMGVAVIIVEQHVRQALAHSHRGIVLDRGRIAIRGSSTELLDRLDDIQSSYLATPAANGAGTA